MERRRPNTGKGCRNAGDKVSGEDQERDRPRVNEEAERRGRQCPGEVCTNKGKVIRSRRRTVWYLGYTRPREQQEAMFGGAQRGGGVVSGGSESWWVVQGRESCCGSVCGGDGDAWMWDCKGRLSVYGIQQKEAGQTFSRGSE